MKVFSSVLNNNS